MTNKEFKLFDKKLNLDLTILFQYLETKHEEILGNTLPENNTLTDLVVKKYNKFNNAPTKLNQKYNLFSFSNEMITVIYNELMDLTKTACEYYGHSFENQDYMIRGWFNVDTPSSKDYNPVINPKLFHDHLGGFGAPDFHGYYSVNAEPSITYYRINENEIYENSNKNNRLVLCQNGFPHSRGNWNECSQRVTIAYDIVPRKRLEELNINNPIWISFK